MVCHKQNLQDGRPTRTYLPLHYLGMITLDALFIQGNLDLSKTQY